LPLPDTRNKTIETINGRQIQKIMLAAAVNLDSSRISDYLKHRPLSTERVQAIESAVEKIAYVWDTFAPFRIILDSPELLDRAYAEAQDERAKRRLSVSKLQRDGAVREANDSMTCALSSN
jgi:hypothetical protein